MRVCGGKNIRWNCVYHTTAIKWCVRWNIALTEAFGCFTLLNLMNIFVEKRACTYRFQQLYPYKFEAHLFLRPTIRLSHRVNSFSTRIQQFDFESNAKNRLAQQQQQKTSAKFQIPRIEESPICMSERDTEFQMCELYKYALGKCCFYRRWSAFGRLFHNHSFEATHFFLFQSVRSVMVDGSFFSRCHKNENCLQTG